VDRLPKEANMHPDEGMFSFWAKSDQLDWSTDSKTYRFGPFAREGILLTATKQYDQSFIVEVNGPFSQPFYFRAATPFAGPEGVKVTVGWKDRRITLFLNEQPMETKAAV
jgi:hypothetical protein